MVYQTIFPLPTDQPSQSVTQFQENFTQLNTQIGTDHFPLVAPTNNGKHQKSTYVELAADPSTAANEVAVYTKSTNTNINPGATVLTQPEMYMREQSNGTIYQMTKGNPNQNNGEGVCFGGLQVRAGTGGIPAGNPGVIGVSFSQRFSTACVSVAVSVNGANVVVQAEAFSPTGFTAKANNGGATSFSYVAVGY
jgi:hypothetical protein